jgi:hypothetical protein
MSKTNKKIVSAVLLIVITCLALSCTTNNYYPLSKEDYQMFKATYIPRDTVYIDPITIGTTTDPE